METKENQVKTLSLLETSKLELNPYKEQIDKILDESKNLACPVGNKELFDSVDGIKKEIKALAIEVEKKDKSIITKFNDAKKDFHSFSLELSEPLRKREKELNDTMKPYLDAKEEAKNAKRIAQEQEEQRQLDLAEKLNSLNVDTIVAISNCETVAEIEVIEKQLEEIDISKETFQEKMGDAAFIVIGLKKKVETEKGKIAAYEAQQKELAELKANKDKEDIERERKDAIVGEINKIKAKAMERLFDSSRIIDLEDVKKTIGISINSFNFQEYSDEAKELELDLVSKIENRISELTVAEANQKLIEEENERKTKEAKVLADQKAERQEKMNSYFKNLEEIFAETNVGDLTIGINSFERLYSDEFNLQSTIGLFRARIQDRDTFEKELIYKVIDIDKVPDTYLHRTVNVELIQEAISSGTKTIKGLKIGKRIDLQ